MQGEKFQTKRVEYRKYLESEGFVDALQRALLKLYDESTKPDDAILFVRQWMCEYCPSEEQFRKMENDLLDAYVRVAELEVEVEKEKDAIVLSPEEKFKELETVFKELQDDNKSESLLRKYYTMEIAERYKETNTPPPQELRLYECIKSGAKRHEAEIGIYACNAACFTTFTDLFDPIIRDRHNQLKVKKPNLHGKPDYGDFDQIKNIDPKKKFVISTCVSLSRNLNNFPFLPKLKFEDYLEIDKLLKQACEKLDGDFVGEYKNIIELDIDKQRELVKKQISFERGDPDKKAAGLELYFPFARSLFINNDETFYIWINAEDHIRVFARENTGNIGNVYKRAVQGLQKLETQNKLKFATEKRYGILTTSIANMGTALNATMRLRLPLLAQHSEYLQSMASDLNLKIKLVNIAEIDDKEDDVILEVTNSEVLGTTEFNIMKSFVEGTTVLVTTEQSLASGAVLQVPKPTPVQ